MAGKSCVDLQVHHQVEEEIKDNVLYVEVDPQPYEGLKIGVNWMGRAINLADTISHGTETYKVMKIELLEREEAKPFVIHLSPKQTNTHKLTGMKWFWKYNLQEISLHKE